MVVARRGFTLLIRGCLNFVFDAEKARFFVQIDTFLSGIAPLRLEKNAKVLVEKMLFLSQNIEFKQLLKKQNLCETPHVDNL